MTLNTRRNRKKANFIYCVVLDIDSKCGKDMQAAKSVFRKTV